MDEHWGQASNIDFENIRSVFRDFREGIMQRALWLIIPLVLFGFSQTCSHASRLATSPGVSNALTRIFRSDGTVIAGLFVGLLDDSVALVVGGRYQKISRHEIWRLTIERPDEEGKAALAGLLLGVYAGNLAFRGGDNQPFAFMKGRNEDDSYLDVLLSAGFALAGAGVGYLVGSSTRGEESFDFAGSEEMKGNEWERLRVFVSGSGSGRVVHLSFQGAWVDTYLPDSEPGSQPNTHSLASNLNMMRKMQLAFTLTDLVDGGVALMWLGQPAFLWSSASNSGTVDMTGRGYYALGIVKPLTALAARNVQWDIGAGVGVSSVEYHRSTYWYSDTVHTPDVTIKKTMLSAMVYTEVKVLLAGYCSLGVTGDYVFIPEKTPVIEELGIPSRGMGTISIGFVLGFHF